MLAVVLRGAQALERKCVGSNGRKEHRSKRASGGGPLVGGAWRFEAQC